MMWNWWTLDERLEALDELLLGGRERRAFHAARAVEDVDELRAFAFDAEHADARLPVARRTVVAAFARLAPALGQCAASWSRRRRWLPARRPA